MNAKAWKFCPQCGTAIGESFKFCSECGEPVSHEARGVREIQFVPNPNWPVYPIYPLPAPLNPWTTYGSPLIGTSVLAGAGGLGSAASGAGMQSVTGNSYTLDASGNSPYVIGSRETMQ